MSGLLEGTSGAHTVEVISVTSSVASPPTFSVRLATPSSGLATSASGCMCHFDHSRFDCACCLPGGCQCGLGLHSKCFLCEPAQTVPPPLEGVPYTYWYKNPPVGVGGFYGDPDHTILNDGGIPSDATEANSIRVAWADASSWVDPEPMLDLGNFRWVRAVRVSYVVSTQLESFAPLNVSVRGGATSTSLPLFSSFSAFSIPLGGAGAHTVELETWGWSERVRYIQLSEVRPSQMGDAILTEVGVRAFERTGSRQCKSSLQAVRVNDSLPLSLCN